MCSQHDPRNGTTNARQVARFFFNHFVKCIQREMPWHCSVSSIASLLPLTTGDIESYSTELKNECNVSVKIAKSPN